MILLFYTQTYIAQGLEQITSAGSNFDCNLGLKPVLFVWNLTFNFDAAPNYKRMSCP